MIQKIYYSLFSFLFCIQFANSQESLPIYSDYLSDNIYLIHPSMAGAANCNKIRMTSRNQWLGVDDAPSLQTLSYNGRIGDSKSAIGAIAYKDQNGYNSQSGVYMTYAHHLLFSRNRIDLNMLSFGISAGFLQYKLDESTFLFDGFFDPLISGGQQTATNFNVDFGFSYHYMDFYAHATVKNFLNNDGYNSEQLEYYRQNGNSYILTAGNVFSSLRNDWSYEPSIMFASVGSPYNNTYRDKFIDLNMKVYKDLDFGKVWGGVSFRGHFDGAEYINSDDQVRSQKSQYFSPIIGLDYNNFVIAYTYSYQANSIVFDNGGYHQITLGINLGCRKQKYDCNCPGIN